MVPTGEEFRRVMAVLDEVRGLPAAGSPETADSGAPAALPPAAGAPAT